MSVTLGKVSAEGSFLYLNIPLRSVKVLKAPLLRSSLSVTCFTTLVDIHSLDSWPKIGFIIVAVFLAVVLVICLFGKIFSLLVLLYTSTQLLPLRGSARTYALACTRIEVAKKRALFITLGSIWGQLLTQSAGRFIAHLQLVEVFKVYNRRKVYSSIEKGRVWRTSKCDSPRSSCRWS